MNQIFSADQVNLGRQKEIDFAKGLAIIFMVLVHAGEIYQGAVGEVYERVVEFFGSPPAAPVFMIALGVGIVYSRRSDGRTLLKRGGKLLVLGYILNVLREVIPYMILAARTGDVMYKQAAWEYLWGADILAFAGLTFIFFGLVKQFKIKNEYLFVIWCGMATLNLILRDISFENKVTNTIAGLFWGTNDYSWFPFLTWIFYPILGYFFGQFLIKCKDKEVFYRRLLVSMGMLSVPLWIYAYINNVQFGAFGELYQGAYYHHDLMGNMILGTFALFWISICFYIVKIIPQKVYSMFARWSRNVDMMYFVHYIILGWLILVIEMEAQTPQMVVVIATCVFIVTDLICIGLKGMSQNRAAEQLIN